MNEDDSVFKLTDEVRDDLPVYEISLEDFQNLLCNGEFVENIGD
jgi:hypothetical protein